MKTEYIREFLEVVRSESLSDAAEKLNMHQPVISKHLRSLEREIGTGLFNRKKLPFVLTDAGKIFFEYAQDWEIREKKCLEEIKRRLTEERRKLVIGVPDLRCYDIISFLAAFKQKNPVYTPEVLITSDNLLYLLKHDRIDFGFVWNYAKNDMELISIPFCSDRLVAFVPDTYPGKSISLREISAEEPQPTDASGDTVSVREYGISAAGTCEKAEEFSRQHPGKAFIAVASPVLTLNMHRMKQIPVSEHVRCSLSIVCRAGESGTEGEKAFRAFCRSFCGKNNGT